MSRLKEILERNGKNYRGVDELGEMLGGYFEDVLFTIETIVELDAVPVNLKNKLRRVRKELSSIQNDINKEL